MPTDQIDQQQIDQKRIERWYTDLRTTGQVVVRPTRSRLVLSLLGTIVFALICLGIGVGAEGLGGQVAGWLGFAFFGVFGVPALLRRIFGSRDQVTVDQQGVHNIGVLVPWQEIRDVSFTKLSGDGAVLLQVERTFVEALAERGPARTAQLADEDTGETIGDFVYLPNLLPAMPSLAAWLAQEAAARGGRR